MVRWGSWGSHARACFGICDLDFGIFLDLGFWDLEFLHQPQPGDAEDDHQARILGDRLIKHYV